MKFLYRELSFYTEFTVPKLVVDANLKNVFYLMYVNNLKFATIIPKLSDNLYLSCEY